MLPLILEKHSWHQSSFNTHVHPKETKRLRRSYDNAPLLRPPQGLTQLPRGKRRRKVEVPSNAGANASINRPPLRSHTPKGCSGSCPHALPALSLHYLRSCPVINKGRHSPNAGCRTPRTKPRTRRVQPPPLLLLFLQQLHATQIPPLRRPMPSQMWGGSLLASSRQRRLVHHRNT